MLAQQLCGKNDQHLKEVLFGQKVLLIHPQVSKDLLALKQAAAKAGFDLHIASGFRSFARQQSIWNRKMLGELTVLDQHSQPIDITALSEYQKMMSILRWSALPGASRHHWGTDFDVYDRQSLPQEQSLKLEPWEYLQGHQSAFYRWLNEHLHNFGFFFPYPSHSRGVAFEPWHISHRATAQACLSQLTFDILKEQLIIEDIIGKPSILAHLESIYQHYIQIT